MSALWRAEAEHVILFRASSTDKSKSTLLQRTNANLPPSIWQDILVATIATMLFLPDVIFMGRSILPSDYVRVMKDERKPEAPRNWITGGNSPSLDHRRHDLGAGAWQFEPALHFMARAIWLGESPYWNPYSATGALGPETLVDLKFSFPTVATALLGGSPPAYHLVVITMFVLAVFCLLRTCTVYFRVGRLAALASVVCYLLGGYMQVYLVTPFLVLIYLLAPPLLLSSFALMQQVTALRFVATVVSYLALFSLSFLPSVIATTLVVSVATLLYSLDAVDREKRLKRYLLVCVLCPSLAFAMLAPLYLPTIAGLADTRLIDQYLVRGIRKVPLDRLPYFFTGATFDNSSIPNIGVVGFALAVVGAASTGDFPWLRRGLLAVSIFGILLIFAVWPLNLVRGLPIIGSIGNSYWMIVFFFPALLLLPFGVEAVVKRNWSVGLPTIGLAFVVGLLIMQYTTSATNGKAAFFAWSILLVGTILALGLSRRRRLAGLAGVVVLALLFVEGAYSTNFTRPLSYNRAADPPDVLAWVRQLASPNSGRVLNVGRRSLYPEWADALGISEAGTMNPSELRWYAAFYHKRIGNEHRFLSLGRSGDYVPLFSDETLDLMGVRYLIVDHGMAGARARIQELGYPIVREDGVRSVFFNAGALDRAFVVGALVDGPGLPADQGVSNASAATTKDGRLLQRARELGISATNSNGSIGSARINSYHHGRVDIDVFLERPGVLLLTDAWHPQWSATVDEAPDYVGLVNEAFRGIALPAGWHHVVMVYQPRFFVASLLISTLAGSLVMAGALCLSHGSKMCPLGR